jgi:hypothetical protein
MPPKLNPDDDELKRSSSRARSERRDNVRNAAFVKKSENDAA